MKMYYIQTSNPRFHVKLSVTLINLEFIMKMCENIIQRVH